MTLSCYQLIVIFILFVTYNLNLVSCFLLADLLHKQDNNISIERTDKMSSLLDRIKGTYITNNSCNICSLVDSFIIVLDRIISGSHGRHLLVVLQRNYNMKDNYYYTKTDNVIVKFDLLYYTFILLYNIVDGNCYCFSYYNHNII